MTPEEMKRYIEAGKDRVLEPLDDDASGPGKTLDDLMAEGKITARQYRSVLFLMQAGYGASSTPEGVVSDIDKKIQELTEIIEREGPA